MSTKMANKAKGWFFIIATLVIWIASWVGCKWFTGRCRVDIGLLVLGLVTIGISVMLMFRKDDAEAKNGKAEPREC